jgi:hypothetical protein
MEKKKKKIRLSPPQEAYSKNAKVENVIHELFSHKDDYLFKLLLEKDERKMKSVIKKCGATIIKNMRDFSERESRTIWYGTGGSNPIYLSVPCRVFSYEDPKTLVDETKEYRCYWYSGKHLIAATLCALEGYGRRLYAEQRTMTAGERRNEPPTP